MLGQHGYNSSSGPEVIGANGRMIHMSSFRKCRTSPRSSRMRLNGFLSRSAGTLMNGLLPKGWFGLKCPPPFVLGAPFMMSVAAVLYIEQRRVATKQVVSSGTESY